MVDEGGKGGGKVVRWDMDSGKGGSEGRWCGVYEKSQTSK